MFARAIRGAFVVLAVCVAVLLVAKARAQVEFTTKGSIVVVCDGVQVSQHNVETEATESAIAFATKKGGKAKCIFVYPNKEVQISFAAVPPTQPVTGSATVTWTAPTTNTDGSAVCLSGYRLYASQVQSAVDSAIPVSLPASSTSFVVSNLAAGTWYFGLVSVCAGSTVSALSSIASKTIQ